MKLIEVVSAAWALAESGLPQRVKSEVSLDRNINKKKQNIKQLIQKLGEAIHESVSESENIAGVVRNIREEGFDVLLMLEATIGLNEVEDDAEEIEAGEAQLQLGDGSGGPFTSNDLTFLRSLRISLSDDMSVDPPEGEGQ